jgi:hypothetical protein
MNTAEGLMGREMPSEIGAAGDITLLVGHGTTAVLLWCSTALAVAAAVGVGGPLDGRYNSKDIPRFPFDRLFILSARSASRDFWTASSSFL